MPRKATKPRPNVFSKDYAPYGHTAQRGSPEQWRSAYEERMMGADEAVAVLDKDNPYTVLGLQQGADKDAVKKAFRAYSMKWHPDVCKDADAADKFKKGHAAYSFLMGK